MKLKLTTGIVLVRAAVLAAGGLADAQEQQSSLSQLGAALPPNNPFLIQNSVYPVTPLQDGVYSLVHVDWDSGEVVGKVNLGTNPIFNTAGGVYIPLNENEIYVTGMFGPVRISRKAE